MGVGAAVAAAVVAAAAAIWAANNQPDPPEPPGTQATPLDKSQLQEEAKLTQLELGEDDKKRRRRRGKSAFVIQLEAEQEAEKAATDPGAVQIDDTGASGLQLGDTEQAQKKEITKPAQGLQL